MESAPISAKAPGALSCKDAPEHSPLPRANECKGQNQRHSGGLLARDLLLAAADTIDQMRSFSNSPIVLKAAQMKQLWFDGTVFRII
jgi:hypothetical protein